MGMGTLGTIKNWNMHSIVDKKLNINVNFPEPDSCTMGI